MYQAFQFLIEKKLAQVKILKASCCGQIRVIMQL